MTPEKKQQIEEIIMDAAISKAIQDKRDRLKPAMQHFINGGNVNGQFDIALKKLMRWVEKKTIESIESVLTAEADKAAALVEALENILTNPSDSCPMCDSGKLRNPNKGHWRDCKFEIAKQALNNYKKQ